MVGFSDREVLNIPNVRAGVLVSNDFLFALDDASGTWIWPSRPGIETEAPGGQEPVGLLIGQTGTETSTWFHDAAVIDGRPMILYREIESETDPIRERMMLYDLESGQSAQLFDKSTRRDGLSQEQEDAPISNAALSSDRIAVLFAFGDSTWIEWYDLSGEPIDGLERLETIHGTVLEFVIADDKLVVGVETELHQLITHLWVADLQTNELTGPMALDSDGQSLNRLAFDGRWLTATIIEPDGTPVGAYLADVINQEVEITTIPLVITPARD